MKSTRQGKILEIINEHAVETQEELMLRLKEQGFNITQATISRDIKDLRLHKALTPDGRYCYTTVSKTVSDARTNFDGFFKDSVLSVVAAQNIIVIKTLPGMANAVCTSLDTFGYREIVGTIAGDDTIFAACTSVDNAEKLASNLKNF